MGYPAALLDLSFRTHCSAPILSYILVFIHGNVNDTLYAALQFGEVDGRGFSAVPDVSLADTFCKQGHGLQILLG